MIRARSTTMSLNPAVHRPQQKMTKLCLLMEKYTFADRRTRHDAVYKLKSTYACAPSFRRCLLTQFKHFKHARYLEQSYLWQPVSFVFAFVHQTGLSSSCVGLHWLNFGVFHLMRMLSHSIRC